MPCRSIATVLVLSIGASFMGCTSPALAQIPQSGWFVGIGAGYGISDFGTRTIHVSDTTTTSINGTPLSQAISGTDSLQTDYQANFSPTFQVGYHRQFASGRALWGFRLSASYLNSVSSASPVFLNVSGSHRWGSDPPQPLLGVVTANSYTASVKSQINLLPMIGHLFQRSYIYFGVGPTLSQIRDEFSDLRIASLQAVAIPGDPSPPLAIFSPVDLARTSWVWGGAATIGATYFLDSSWTLDLNYIYARSANYSNAMAHSRGSPQYSSGTTIEAAGHATTQGVLLTVSMAL